MNSISHNGANQSKPTNFISKKLIDATILEVNELIVYTETKSKAEKNKRQEMKDLLENMKEFLVNKNADNARKIAIILRMPLLQVTIRKA